jgi:hypothetical protein
MILSTLLVCLLPLLAAQNPTQSNAAAPKYRTHFVIYDVQKKTTSTLFTIEGEWHAPNWTPDGKYIVSDMGDELYRIPVNGANAGKPKRSTPVRRSRPPTITLSRGTVSRSPSPASCKPREPKSEAPPTFTILSSS